MCVEAGEYVGGIVWGNMFVVCEEERRCMDCGVEEGECMWEGGVCVSVRMTLVIPSLHLIGAIAYPRPRLSLRLFPLLYPANLSLALSKTRFCLYV